MCALYRIIILFLTQFIFIHTIYYIINIKRISSSDIFSSYILTQHLNSVLINICIPIFSKYYVQKNIFLFICIHYSKFYFYLLNIILKINFNLFSSNDFWENVENI